MMMLKMMMPSVPKMPGGDDGEKKEESAESREEAKEQEAMRQKAIKDAEKERANFYAKQKEGQKDVRAKYREKYKIAESPIPSAEEESSSEDEEDGPRKPKIDPDDPVAQAKAQADKAKAMVADKLPFALPF